MQEKPKTKRPDTPLANTPEPTPLYLQTQVGIRAGRTALETLREREKIIAERQAKKAMDEAREKLNREPSPLKKDDKMKPSDFIK